MPDGHSQTHVALARKYRPQVFEDVVAQEHVTRTLANAIRSGRLANAYLFVGPRGVGKTTLARIYAKAINCEKGPTPQPCNACELCRSIAEGRCLDVLEFDAASNTQVDRVREIIIDNIGYRPAQARYKVFIVDEVHMLSVSSFNALLKTLEEPPAHVKFVFATTEPQKIPATILSRCQRFDLRRIPTSAIVQTLEKIARAEGISLEHDAALAIARGAEGGLRDAESVLDQLIAFCGDTIREADVLSVFGLVSWAQMQKLIDAILNGDIATMFSLVAEMDAAGKDLLRLSIELLDYVRDLLVVAHTGRLVGEEVTDDGRLDALRAQASRLDPIRLAKIADMLVELQTQMRHSLSRRTLLELALVRAARAAKSVSLEDVIAALGEAPPQPAPARREVSPMPSLPLFGGEAPSNAMSTAPASDSSARTEPARDNFPAPEVPAERPPKDDSAEILARLSKEWSSLVEKVSATNPILRACLKDARLSSVQGDCVRITFDPEFASSRDKLNVPRNLVLLQKAIEKVARRPMRIELTVGDPVAPVKENAVETPQEPGTAPNRAAGAKRDWTKEEAVRRAIEAFNGEIADIRE